MSESKVNGIMDTTMEKLRTMVDADTIIGTPLTVGKITLIPVSRVSFGMATGGSGDVLSGILVSLLAQGIAPDKAAMNAVFLHGESGDKAAKRKGECAMLPSDIIEEL